MAQEGQPPIPRHGLDLKSMFSLEQHEQGKRKVRPPNCFLLRVHSTKQIGKVPVFEDISNEDKFFIK